MASTAATKTAATTATKSWQDLISESIKVKAKADKEDTRATTLLWDGAQGAIMEWTDKAGTDPKGEALTSELLELMGKERKGDVSKIKTVALAVVNKGLDMTQFPSLSKAYASARHLNDGEAQQERKEAEEAAQDAAASSAIEKITEEVKAEEVLPPALVAAKVVLANGLDAAARIMLDALGVESVDAHRAFQRVLAEEIATRSADRAARIKSEAKPKASEPQEEKAGAKVAPAKPTKPKAAVKAASTKPKPITKTTKAAPKTVEEAIEADTDGLLDIEDEADLFDSLEETEVVEAPAPKRAATKGRPAVKGRPVRKA